MRYATRFSLALGLVGAVAIGGAALAQSDDDAEASPGEDRTRNRGQLVHGEHTFIDEDGALRTVLIDHGTVVGLDGDTVRLERADGETLTVAADEDTRIGRNGERVELAALQEGDLIRTMRVRDEEGTRLVAIKARSEDWEPERRFHRRGFGRGFGHGPRFDRTPKGDAIEDGTIEDGIAEGPVRSSIATW